MTKTPSNIKIVAENKKARFDFHVEDTFEAGLVLTGSEVKSVRGGHVSLKDSYVSFRNGEAFLQKAHISIYAASSYNNHEPERLRKLLLHKLEIEKIERAVTEKGYTCVPLKVYLKGGRVKLEVALVRGKKHGDKREAIKNRESDRELARARSRK